MLSVFIKGFLIGAGLIIAIGAQNAFVLSKGVKREHHIIIPLICSICDTSLIFAGIAGLGPFVSSNRSMTVFAAVFGAVFLYWYGFKSFKNVFKSEGLKPDEKSEKNLYKSVLATLGVTLLNPHVYLDTVVLTGTIASRFDDMKYIFGLGASTASFIWFFLLSLGGSAMAEILKKPSSWRILDTFVGITMWWIASNLLINSLHV